MNIFIEDMSVSQSFVKVVSNLNDLYKTTI